MKIKLSFVLIIIIALPPSSFTLAQTVVNSNSIKNKPRCKCTPAKANETPVGANEIVEINGGKVKQLKGYVTDLNGDYINGVIVEVFDYKNADKDKSLYNIANSRKRRAACWVSKDGRFCFSNLPRGDYLLRVGTIGGGFNYGLVKVTLSPKEKDSSDKEIEILLTVGT